MPTPRAVAALLTALTLTGVQAADPVRLGKDEVEKLLPGKTLNYANVNGSSAVVVFGVDGRASYKTGGTRESIGTWSIQDDGRYCIKITTGSAQDHCRFLWRTDAGLRLRNTSGEFVPVSGLD